jgi:hypothetical protein
MFNFQQSQQEYNKNIEALEASLLPKKIAATESNGTLLAKWLMKHCTSNGVVDASVSNMRKGISQLHAAELVDWDVAPGKKIKLVQQERNSEIPNHARDNSPDIKAKITILDDQSKARDAAEADAIIQSAVSLAKNVSRNTHSKSYALRENLQGIIDAKLKQTPNPTPQQAQGILDAVTAKERVS